VTELTQEITYQPAEAVHIGDAPADLPQRKHVLRLLANIPIFMDTVRKLSRSDVFRVVMTKGNAYFFKQGADGFYKPYLHNGKHFVENVDLMRVSPDYVGAVSNVALMANMAAIAAKLEAIEVGVRNVARLVADTQRGRVKGAIHALTLARALADSVERRRRRMTYRGHQCR
jgi:hypothetical protein